MLNGTSDSRNYDAVIIGGGHNGLVCACYLARSGLSVLVVEAREVLGGACVTEELIPGYKCSTASLVNSLFRPEIVNDLGLPSHGLQFITRDPAVTSLLPEENFLMLGSDEEMCTREIARISKRDAEAFPRYARTMARLASHVEPHLLGICPDLDPKDAEDIRSALLQLLRIGDDELILLIRLLFGSAESFLDQWFEHEALKAALVIDGITGVDASPAMPGTAFLMLYHLIGQRAVGRPAWGQIRGGMGGLTSALASAARSYGVDFVVGNRVERVLTNGDRAVGVALESGREIFARVTISSADPHVTFIRLVGREALPPSFARAVDNIQFHGVAMKIHLALAHLPRFRGLPSDEPAPQHRGTVLIAPTMEYLDQAYADTRKGLPSRYPHVECTFPTVLDETLAPAGRHLMGIYLQYTPFQLAEGSWDERKHSYAKSVIQYIETYAPGFSNSILDMCVLSPLDLERDFNLTGGCLYHGAMTPGYLFSFRPVVGWAKHRTPIRDLYLCGSGAHPGGGVSGVPGRNGAAQVLKDLRCSAASILG